MVVGINLPAKAKALPFGGGTGSYEERRRISLQHSIEDLYHDAAVVIHVDMTLLQEGGQLGNNREVGPVSCSDSCRCGTL